MNRLMIAALGCAVVLGMAGCSARKAEISAADQLRQELEARDAQIGELEDSITNLEQDLQSKQAEAEAKARAAAKAEAMAREAEARAKQAQAEAGNASTTTASGSSFMGSEMLPPNAKPGECYARVFVPPTYTTETDRLLKSEATSRLEIVPAKYDWAEQKILVKEASSRLEVVSARYDWVEEKVLVKEASSRMEQVPAKYDTVSEQVLVKPAHTVWKKGRGPVEKVDEATGEIMCLVEVPAQHRTVTKKVQVAPPTTRKVEIPAEYKTVRVKKVVTPPQERKIDIPAAYQTVTRNKMVTEGRMEWREILCETNLRPGLISDLQRALAKAGHDPGPIDGVYGSRTDAAVRSFQRAKGMASGSLTMSTLKALGVSL